MSFTKAKHKYKYKKYEKIHSLGGAGGIGGSGNNFAMIKDKLIMLAQQMINTLQGLSSNNYGSFDGGINGGFNGGDFGFDFGSIGASNSDYNFGQDLGIHALESTFKKEKKKE